MPQKCANDSFSHYLWETHYNYLISNLDNWWQNATMLNRSNMLLRHKTHQVYSCQWVQFLLHAVCINIRKVCAFNKQLNWSTESHWTRMCRKQWYLNTTEVSSQLMTIWRDFRWTRPRPWQYLQIYIWTWGSMRRINVHKSVTWPHWVSYVISIASMHSCFTLLPQMKKESYKKCSFANNQIKPLVCTINFFAI